MLANPVLDLETMPVAAWVAVNIEPDGTVQT
jgi:hypothetical protein